MTDEPTTEGNDESTRDRVTRFVESIEDVPGVSASVRGVGEACYAGVVVDHDYGNREEYGDGVVSIAEDADPVGQSAYFNGMKVAKVVPFAHSDNDQTRIAFATDDAFGESHTASVVAELLRNALDPDDRGAVMDVAVGAFGDDIVDYAKELAQTERVEQ